MKVIFTTFDKKKTFLDDNKNERNFNMEPKDIHSFTFFAITKDNFFMLLRYYCCHFSCLPPHIRLRLVTMFYCRYDNLI